MYGYGMNSDFQMRNVAIYARVSTEHYAQLLALENQLDWYRPILAARPDWTLVGQYIDEGITGTSAEKRPQFMKMIEDAKNKKFDMIITREVSRFARNTVDTLQYTRKLKEYGVEVFFINDNIKTFDGDGELRLTIMATLAQDESRKISIRAKAGQQTSMEKGVFYGNGSILGYDRVGKDLVINPEQAKTVRMIFDMYLSGMGVTSIQYELEKQGRLTATGKTVWHGSYISRMLKNSFYCGIITYHKEYTPDYLKQKKMKNYGELELLKVQGTHTPIISVEEFNQAQELMDSRAIYIKNRRGTGKFGKRPQTTAWGRLLICQCGNKFNCHYSSRKDRTLTIDYQCYTSVNIGSKRERERRGLSTMQSCDSPFLSGWKLDFMAKNIFDRYISNASQTVELAYTMLEAHIADKEEIVDNSDLISRKELELERLTRKRENLIGMREDGDIDRSCFRNRKNELDKKIGKLTAEIQSLEPQEVEQTPEDFTVTLRRLKEKLESYIPCKELKIPTSIVEAFIEKIWVSKNEFRWYLRRSDNPKEVVNDEDRVMIGSFTLNFDQAKEYIYSFSTRRRVYRWFDLNVSVWL